MKAATEKALAAIIAADETISQRDAAAALALLRDGLSLAQSTSAAARVPYMTRAEAAKALKVSLPTISTWGRAGIIRRVAVPGRRRALGYRAEDVENILNGEGANNGKR